MEFSKRPLFTCSIDDGHPSDMRAAELLDKHGFGATFFIPVHNREDASMITPVQMQQIGRRFEVGSHTFDHCYLNYVDVREAYFQIAVSKQRLEDLLGKPVHGFCYPGGRYRKRDVDLVKACNFRYARTTANLFFSAGSSAFEMPTTIQFFPHQRDVYLRNFIVGGVWHRRAAGLAIAMLHQKWMDRLYALFDHLAGHGKVFHLWWHSKQLDELNAWRDLERFLAYVAARIPAQDRLSNVQIAERFFGREVMAMSPRY